MAVLEQMLQQDLVAVCGERGRHDPERGAYRHGSEPSSLALGGRRVPVRRPRARSIDGQELALPT